MYQTSKSKQISDIHQQLLSTIKSQMDPQLYESLFDDDAGFELKDIENNKATFVCCDETTASIIRNAMLNTIQAILSNILETKIEVEILNKNTYINRKNKYETNNSSFFKNAHLDSQMTFDTFVVGPNNKAAYAASMLSVSAPSSSNPIFLYSKSGLGKTHLLNAIGNEYSFKNPEAKVLYITSDDFLNEAVKYMKGRSAEELRDFFTTIDMLLIDDIQFLAGKTETQTMFFNVFNYLISAHKQIVITSDKEPDELKDLPERLISRFKGGLTISITAPTKDTLVEILKMKIKIKGYKPENFTEEAIQYLANNYSKNVRELNGAFTNLLFAIATTDHGPTIDLNFVERVLKKDNDNKKINSKTDISTIIKIVSNYFNISESQLKGKCRIAQIAFARQIAMFLSRDVLNMTYQSIGETFDKDHTTVMANVNKIDKDRIKDASLNETINNLENKLGVKQSN